MRHSRPGTEIPVIATLNHVLRLAGYNKLGLTTHKKLPPCCAWEGVYHGFMLKPYAAMFSCRLHGGN